MVEMAVFPQWAQAESGYSQKVLDNAEKHLDGIIKSIDHVDQKAGILCGFLIAAIEGALAFLGAIYAADKMNLPLVIGSLGAITIWWVASKQFIEILSPRSIELAGNLPSSWVPSVIEGDCLEDVIGWEAENY